ncbi:hypothetical protein PSACC_01080 [Paramicrosporidium saccamoebae]|uniref:Uncharacterized protein n=1 Tax=Paramicrosporidium saccamoebae TaxID=1246581 RepID=A0A2H9TN24_9FUNG|nr:hypothetical protein PSACC_01080 [Paramicrosporidium saccamoebae]
MFNIAYVICWFSTALCLVINSSVSELVLGNAPHTTLHILFSAVCNQNFGKFLSRWLATDLASVQDIYNTSCQQWTAEHLQWIIPFAQNSPLYLRDLLFSSACLKAAPKDINVYEHLSQSMIPFRLRKRSKAWDQKLWGRLLEYLPPEYSSSWCKWAPFRNEKWLKSFDLPFHLSLECLTTKYSKRDSVIKYTIDQIPTVPASSLSRLIIELDKIKGRTLPGLRKAVRYAACNPTGETLFHKLNEWAIGCRHHGTLNNEGISMLVKRTMLQRGELLILALRLLLKKLGMKETSRRLREFTNPGHVTMPRSLQLVALYGENMDETLATSQEFFSFFNIDHDEFLLERVSNNFWASNMDRFYEMPLTWRLRYYRKNMIFGAMTTTSVELDQTCPTLYALGVFGSEQSIQEAIKQKVYSTNGMSISTDCTGVITIDSIDNDNLTLDSILTMMIYGLIRFGRFVALLDSKVCRDLHADSALAKYLGDAIDRTHNEWTLDFVFRGTDFCSLFSTQHAIKGDQ